MIKIDEDFYISSVKGSYVVCGYYNKDKSRPLIYYSTLKEALTELIKEKQHKLVAENDLTLQEAINEFKRIEEEIEQAFKENIKEGEEQGQIQS